MIESDVKASGRMLETKCNRQRVVSRNSMRQRAPRHRRSRHRDRTGNRKRVMTGMRHEIASAHCAAFCRRRDQHWLWNDPICRIRNAHQFARLDPKRFKAVHEIAIGIEFGRRLVTGLSKSDARMSTTGIAASTQETSMPSTRSSGRPVGNNLPVFEPAAPRNARCMGAAVPGTPSIEASPS